MGELFFLDSTIIRTQPFPYVHPADLDGIKTPADLQESDGEVWRIR
jgi:hypothetical protein